MCSLQRAGKSEIGDSIRAVVLFSSDTAPARVAFITQKTTDGPRVLRHKFLCVLEN